MKKDYKCRTCEYHDVFSWVCSNVDSDYCADFTDDEDWCSAYTAKKRENENINEKNAENPQK